MCEYERGEKVRVSSDNDNENYNSFRGHVLKITHVAHNTTEHPGYDSGVGGCLYDLYDTETKQDVDCSLYDYELEPA
jgi:hypothetical protein